MSWSSAASQVKFSRGAINSSSGTGYGGDARQDKEKRKALKRQAQDNEKQHALCQEALLKSAKDALLKVTSSSSSSSSSDPPPSKEVIQTSREILRNQADFTSRQPLYHVALDVCELITKHFPQILGKEDDDESLLFALQESASMADVIIQHPNDCQQKDVKLAQKVIQIRDEAVEQSRAAVEQPDLTVFDHHEHYRQQLRSYTFEFVDTLPNHYFAATNKTNTRSRNWNPRSSSTATTTSPAQRKKLLKELTAYKTSLPVEYGSSIFVRAMEGQMNLLRALILGPDDSPYACGCFIFDICLDGYPTKPPKVQFVNTGGYRFNPNLYECGKVCLSLLGTWSGPGWVAGESTLLQVLVSIQSLILVNKPYFNEPGYQSSEGTPSGEAESDSYNLDTRRFTIDAAILPFIRDVSVFPYPEFETVIQKHFHFKKSILQQQLHQWYIDANNNSTNKNTGRAYKKYSVGRGREAPDMLTLYNNCLQVWESQIKSRKRKAASSSKEMPIEIDLGDDDDDDDEKNSRIPLETMENNETNIGKMAAGKTGSSMEDDVIEVDLFDGGGEESKKSASRANKRKQSSLMASAEAKNNNSAIIEIIEDDDDDKDEEEEEEDSKPSARRQAVMNGSSSASQRQGTNNNSSHNSKEEEEDAVVDLT